MFAIPSVKDVTGVMRLTFEYVFTIPSIEDIAGVT